MVTIHGHKSSDGCRSAAGRFLHVNIIDSTCDEAGEGGLACVLISNGVEIKGQPKPVAFLEPEPGMPDMAIKKRLEVGVFTYFAKKSRF